MPKNARTNNTKEYQNVQGKEKRLGTSNRKKSKIDDEINSLIAWREKYPKAKIVPSVSEEILREYAETEEEYRQILKEYEKMQIYYGYIRDRKSRGKLRAEQFQRCKEGNIGGVFGYPIKIEELAQKYGKTEEEIDFIITKYGTMEKFFQLYSSKGIKDEKDIILARSIIKSKIELDIDGNNNEGYDKLIEDLIDMFEESRDDTDVNVILYSSKTLQEALQELTQNQRYVIERRYDLTGKGKYASTTTIGEKMGVSTQRISQIIEKAKRKLIKINGKNSFICNIEELKNSQLLTDEEKAEISEIEDLLSKLRILSTDIASEKLDEIFDFLNNIRKKLKKEKKK